MGTAQVAHMLRAGIQVALYCASDGQVDHMFCRALAENNRRSDTVLAKEMSPPSPFEMQLYFHLSKFLEDCIRKTHLSILGTHSSGMYVACTVHFVMMAWNPCRQQLG